jgi:hypothetical protein
MVTTRSQLRSQINYSSLLDDKISNNKIRKSTYQNVDIDFDFASRMWKRNKKSIGDGSYVYICGYKTLKNSFCKNKSGKYNQYCYLHRK